MGDPSAAQQGALQPSNSVRKAGDSLVIENSPLVP